LRHRRNYRNHAEFIFTRRLLKSFEIHWQKINTKTWTAKKIWKYNKREFLFRFWMHYLFKTMQVISCLCIMVRRER
jgi:hypothetical protein